MVHQRVVVVSEPDRIPDAMENVELTADTVAALSVRFNIPAEELWVQLQKDLAAGKKSVYSIAIYYPDGDPRKVVPLRNTNKASNGRNPTIGGLMNRFNPVLKEVRERPIEAAAVAVAALVAIGKFADSVASVRSKNAYARQIKNKSKNRR
jgi:hypothetical protein